ncbi:hypothetical protein ACOSP7_014039 [Xanthoceras sorbifolium]
MYNIVRFIMGDSHQGNNKEERKMCGKIVQSMDRDSKDLLSNVTVERKILPTLNGKLGCQKTFVQYQSRLKWLKQRYNNYSEFMRHKSGFGCDHVTKKFTASDEVWEDYFKSYPTHTFADYEYLRIAIRNGTAVGRHSIVLGDDTDVRAFVAEERQGDGLEDLTFDTTVRAFIHNDQQKNEPLSPRRPSSPLPSQPISSEIPQITRK